MTLDELLATLPPAGLDDIAFPHRLLGAFRRKSITFCNGMTDETTPVYWFQSRSFTIDLRLPDGPETPLTDRQGWIGDTLWDKTTRQMSWDVGRSYQPRNQWPEPASLGFIGNAVLEFAPSGAYVEDWRQLSTRGPLLGLRLVSLVEDASGQSHAMDGGLIVAGDNVAFACSRLPAIDRALAEAPDLARALSDGIASASQIESYEVSLALGGDTVTASTLPRRLGQPILPVDAFAIDRDGAVTLPWQLDGRDCHLRFARDLHVPDFAFANQTSCTAEASRWLAQESGHLLRNAAMLR